MRFQVDLPALHLKHRVQSWSWTSRDLQGPVASLCQPVGLCGNNCAFSKKNKVRCVFFSLAAASSTWSVPSRLSLLPARARLAQGIRCHLGSFSIFCLLESGILKNTWLYSLFVCFNTCK